MCSGIAQKMTNTRPKNELLWWHPDSRTTSVSWPFFCKINHISLCLLLISMLTHQFKMVNITVSHHQVTLSLLLCSHASVLLTSASQIHPQGCSLLVCFYSCIKFDVTFITCPFVTSLCSAACLKGWYKCITHSYLPQISGESWNEVLNMCHPVRHLCWIPYLHEQILAG